MDDDETPVSVISSLSEFSGVFEDKSETVFLVCYETPRDGVTGPALEAFTSGVRACVARHGVRLRLALWECSSPEFAAARAQLEKRPGHPLLLMVYRGAVADTLRDKSLERMLADDMDGVCRRIASFQSTSKPASVVVARGAAGGAAGPAAPATMRVDVAKIMGLGKKMLAEGQAVYAEKFFIKAAAALEAVEADVAAAGDAADVRDWEGSLAMALAFAGLAQMAQGRPVDGNEHIARLKREERLLVFVAEPLSDASRAVTTADLIRAAPRQWSGETCSQKKLGEALKANPQDMDSRAMLVITLFLSGDLERCLTEAVKLHTLGAPFGRTAIKKVKAFLGPDNELAKRVGDL